MKRILLLPVLALALIPATPAQSANTLAYQVKRTTNAPPAPLPPGDRFLILVDTSLSMRKLDAANRQAVFDMIFNGLHGRMRDGDTYGLWTFNEQTHAGEYPMQTWKADENMQQASRAALFLKNQPYEHDTQFGITLVKLDSVLRAVRDLNIFILTDGDTRMQGTPFDSVINAGYEKRGGERKKLKKPFVTTFIAREGRVLSGGVTIAGEPIVLPERVEPAPLVQAPEPQAVPPPARPKQIAAIVITNATPAKPAFVETTNSAPLPLASVNPPPANVAGTNSTITEAPPPDATTNSPKAEPTFSEQVVPPSNAVAPTAEKPLVVPTPAPTASLLVPLVVSAREPATHAGAAAPSAPGLLTAVVVAPEPWLSPRTMFLIGLVLLAGAMGLIIFFARRFQNAPQPSIISQSMDRR